MDNNSTSKGGILDSKKMALPQSDLLSRVGAFLPQIQKANKELEELPADKSARVDLELQSDNDDNEEDSKEDDGNSSDSDGDNSDDEDFLIKESKGSEADQDINRNDDDGNGDSESGDSQQNEKAPTIEFKLALGALDQNPAMALLDSSTGEKEEKSDEKLESEEYMEGDESKEKHTAISNLLVNGTKRKREDEKPKGPLITEIS